MDQQKQITMALHELYSKIGWLNKLKLAEAYQQEKFQLYTASEIACIEYIGNHADANNITRLAESFYMTRSALSKMTKKLMKKGIIEGYRKPGNKKELYFRLTGPGREIYDIHEEMTKRFLQRDQVVFQQTPPQLLEEMQRFFDRYNQHLDTEIQKMNPAD